MLVGKVVRKFGLCNSFKMESRENSSDAMQKSKTSSKSGNRYSIDMILGRLMQETNTKEQNENNNSHEKTNPSATSETENGDNLTVIDDAEEEDVDAGEATCQETESAENTVYREHGMATFLIRFEIYYYLLLLTIIYILFHIYKEKSTIFKN